MNGRDLTLISAATLFGAAASATAIRFFFNPRKNNSASVTKTVVQRKSLSYNPFDPSKRTGYLSWDDYFMAIAFLSAERSKDPNRQVGACLVSQDGIILGIGYNGFPRGCSDDKLPWSKKSKTGDPLETKYPYVCHAEVNAILNTNHATAVGQRLYVTMFPCNECAKIIIQECSIPVGHIYRECNKSTDLLTNIGCKEEKKCIYDGEHIPNRLSGIIRLDKLGFPDSGVSEVIYFVEKRSNNSETPYIASCKLLSMAGVKVRRHQPQMKQILLNFEEN